MRTIARDDRGRFAMTSHPEGPSLTLSPGTFTTRMKTLTTSSAGGRYADAGDLEHLSVYAETPHALKSGGFTFAGEHVWLDPHDPVFTRQAQVSHPRVVTYVEAYLAGDTVADVQVTDIVPGGGVWHLNGLHRIVAARIVGVPVIAEIWR